jgi:hypothetical protein
MGAVKPTVIATTIGVDIGQRADPSAVVVSEQLPGDRHRVHHIERLALQTAYPQVAERLRVIYQNTVNRVADRQELEEHRADLHTDPSMRPPPDIKARQSVHVLVDATGCGLPVVDFLRESAGIEHGHLTGVMFTAGVGCSVVRGAPDGTVSKAYLVSRLKSLMGFGRLEWPKSDAARELADELQDFELTVNDNATPQWNARAGTHDDLVCACALAVLIGGGAHTTSSESFI